MATSRSYDLERDNAVPLAENWCFTTIKLINYSHMWTIKNFSLYTDLVEVLHSTIFTSSDEDPVKWQLCVYPNGIDDQCRDSLSVFLSLVKSDDVPVHAKYTISLLDASKNKVMRKTDNEAHKFFEGLMLGFNKIVSKEFMMNAANGILFDDSITILCEVSMMDGYVNTSGVNTAVSFDVQECQLSEDLGGLFNNDHLSDVTLCVDGHEFPAHRVVLAAQSSTFATLLSDLDTESNLNRVDITNVNHEVMSELLRYLYTGRSPNIDLMTKDLLAASDIYHLGHLKTLCEVSFQRKLKYDSAIQILIYSDMYSALHLKAKAIEYINTHNTNAIMASDGGKELCIHYPHLLEELYKAMIKTQGMVPCFGLPYKRTRR